MTGWRIQGIRNVERGLKALRQVFKPLGREWADQTAALAKTRVVVRTGRTQKSIRRKNASQKRATVVARYGARYLEGGAPPHTITPKRGKRLAWKDGGAVRFAKKVDHPGMKRKKFLRPSGKEVLDRMDKLKHVIGEWNRAIK